MIVEMECRPRCDMLLDCKCLPLPEIVKMLPGEIENLPVVVGAKQEPLGEHFRVSVSISERDELILSGETHRNINAGFGMKSGHLLIHGIAGPFSGAEMSGGYLEIYGNADICLGAAMMGGLIRVYGSTGDWCGAAYPGQASGMTGGTIIVDGNTGFETGSGMRRGLIAVGGNCGDFTGFKKLAGTILCVGVLGYGSGVEMKRGSLIAGKSKQLLPGFSPTGKADLEWLRIYLKWLSQYGFNCPSYMTNQAPQRFSGDHLELGKGEVLVYDFVE